MLSDDGPIGRARLLGTLERARAVSCAVAERTASLPDFTRALASAYPDLDWSGRTQRLARSRLRAADVEHERDHRTVRELRLAYLETEIPRLHGHPMHFLLRRLFVQRTPHRPLAPGDLAELVAAAEGLPGRAVWFYETLSQEAGWSSDRPRVAWLRSEAVIRAPQRYRADLAR